MGNNIHIVLFCGTLLYSNVCGTAVISRHRSLFWNHHESSFHSIHIDSLFVHSVIPNIPSSMLSYFLSNTSILLQKCKKHCKLIIHQIRHDPCLLFYRNPSNYTLFDSPCHCQTQTSYHVSQWLQQTS